MTEKYDSAIVGAGIVGLAHAWSAARRGDRIILFDRTPRAEGATIRNFGMVWPIGQPAGELYDTAMRSREFWLELHREGVLDADACGSVHLAHHDDELAVLEEFASSGPHDCKVLTPEETLKHVPIANPSGLRGGLWSPTELRVDPRTAASNIARWLVERHAVDIQFNVPITSVTDHRLTATDGRSWCAEKIVICSGSDLQTLYPKILARSGLRLCKLQMLRTTPQNVQQSAHVASGLTLRHYTSFQHCPTLATLRKRIAEEDTDLDQYGIHVMATQAANGELILGDSHEYDTDITPFHNQHIDDLILRELKKIICLPNWTIRQRWQGVYAKHSELPIFWTQAERGVEVCVGPGGAGMTMSFGMIVDQEPKLD